MPDRTSIEIRNLAEVRRAISRYAEQGRSLTEGLVRELHQTLIKGVPEAPGEPLKPGEFRDDADDRRFAGFKHLKKHRPPAWRERSELTTLVEDTENGRLAPDWGRAAGRFHYRFLRIHPFSDGNGRMARALSTLLLTRNHPEVLLFEKPIDEVILEHHEDYVGVLEYYDGIYEDLRGEDIPEEEKLRWAERPFSDFYARAFLEAYHENNEKLLKRLEEKLLKGLRDKGVAVRRPKVDQSMYDLNLEAIKASHPRDETLKAAFSRGYVQT